MNLGLLVLTAVIFIFPAYCANAAPVIAGGGFPIDFGKNFVDGKRIFGNNKTFRGFLFGFLTGLFVGVIITSISEYSFLLAIFAPLGALLGDLMGAFLKRRLNIPPGSLFPVVDQVDFVVGALLLSFPIINITWQLALTVLLITPPIHLLTNFLAYKLKLKKHPW